MRIFVKNTMSSLMILLTGIIFVLVEIPAFGAIGDWKIQISNNELAADIQNAPFGKIIEEIRKRTGIEFFFNRGQSDRIITVKFGFLPLDKALVRILSKFNHTVSFGADGNILGVTIIGTNKTSSVKYREPFADDQFLGRNMNPEHWPDVKTEDQVSEQNYEMVVNPTLIADEMPIEPPSGEEMEIIFPSDADMMVSEPPEGEDILFEDPFEFEVTE